MCVLVCVPLKHVLLAFVGTRIDVNCYLVYLSTDSHSLPLFVDMLGICCSTKALEPTSPASGIK